MNTVDPTRAERKKPPKFYKLTWNVIIQSLSLVCWSHILYINMKGRNQMPIDKTIRLLV